MASDETFSITEVKKKIDFLKSQIAEHEKNISEEYAKRYKDLCEEFDRKVDVESSLIVKPLK